MLKNEHQNRTKEKEAGEPKVLRNASTTQVVTYVKTVKCRLKGFRQLICGRRMRYHDEGTLLLG
jgi:hypothetical protein